MANVYTKKHHRPRTTTLSHFGPIKPYQPPRLPRILSPTRRCNPHPTGLVYQSPYNKDNMVSIISITFYYYKQTFFLWFAVKILL